MKRKENRKIQKRKVKKKILKKKADFRWPW